MAAKSGTSNGPSWGDALAVLTDYYLTYGVAVSLRIFPMVGLNHARSFGVQFTVHDCYGQRIGERFPGYSIWPSHKYATLAAGIYCEALACDTFVRECAAGAAADDSTYLRHAVQ